jgi:hypothetical protein
MHCVVEVPMANVEDEESDFEGQEEHWLIDSGATAHVTNNDIGKTEFEGPEEHWVDDKVSDRERNSRSERETRQLGNMEVTSDNDKSSNELYPATKPKNMGWLIQFGRNGYVTIRTKITTKINSAEYYRLNNPAAELIVHSRDIGRNDWERTEKTQEPTSYEGKEVEMYENEEDSLVHDLQETPARTRATSTAGRNEGGPTADTILDTVKAPEKAARAQRATNYKAERIDYKAERIEGDALKQAPEKAAQEKSETREMDANETTAEQFVYNAAVMSDPGTSETIEDALSGHHDKVRWRESAMAEINKKIKRKERGSWKKIKRKEKGSWKKIKRNEKGSKKKIKRNENVEEKMRKIIPPNWELKKIEPNENEPFVKASMNDMAETISGDNEDHVGRSIKEAKTSRFPGNTLQMGEDDKAEGIDMEKYRSLVGKSMYYATKIAPDCANAAKELSQYMERPSQENWRAMERLVCYMKRIDMRMHSMRDEVTAGKVKVITEERKSDTLTTNVNDDRLFQHLVRDLLSGTLRCCNREDVKMEGLSSDRGVGTPAITSQETTDDDDEWKAVVRKPG